MEVKSIFLSWIIWLSVQDSTENKMTSIRTSRLIFSGFLMLNRKVDEGFMFNEDTKIYHIFG
ncbi:hypothetical protein DQQ10_21800 [Pseudochryseolinea flava]|uniref:Uncharacterized protein n=1 Tax=Pseudochryseolinea flava TaxID=2059302 RepID=A0A364XXE9_9BACT|nr:hypothetical protein DQQ10_21800 [Pseudochryseolinea flava]